MPSSPLQTLWTLFYFMLLISQLTMLIVFYWDYIPSDIINNHCNEQKLLRWFHYFISILEYKIHYTSRTAIHLHYLLTHSTAPLSRCTSEEQNRSKQDKQEEVRSGVSPRYSGDMQHVPCQRGVTLLQLLHSAEEDCFPSWVQQRT